MSNDIIKNQLDAYRPNFLKHGVSPQGTFQNNNATVKERHRQLLEPLIKLRPQGFSICDIGSGLCDLHKYLIDLGIQHDYTGIEIVPEMVSIASQTYPEAKILNADFLNPSFDGQFDFIVLSGTFNLPGSTPSEDWEKYVFAMIKQMYEKSNLAISFNALTTYTTFRSNELFYLNPEKTFSFIQNTLSRFCMLNTFYPLFECTYTVIKPQIMQQLYFQPEFSKYFPTR
jgi:hypothetical protein